MQGVLGSLLIRLNVEIALRRNTLLREWPILEVVCVSAVTAAVSYLVSVFSPIFGLPIELLSPDCFRQVNLFHEDFFYSG